MQKRCISGRIFQKDDATTAINVFRDICYISDTTKCKINKISILALRNLQLSAVGRTK